MFKLLSKESNIFSIPVYIILTVFLFFDFNILKYTILDFISTAIAFSGIALGFFVFGQIKLTYQTHLSLFLYMMFAFAWSPGILDLGLGIALLTNSFLLFVFTSSNERIQKQSYLLVGSILLTNFIFFPPSWPMFIFVILHIIATSQKIALNLFRLFLGIAIMLFGYWCIFYTLSFSVSWDNLQYYLPILTKNLVDHSIALAPLIPIALLSIYAISEHFRNYNKKSPISKFKYTFLLIFALVQSITIILYMGENFEFLLLLAFPISLIISKMLKFLPQYWMKEVGLWLVILSLLAFKINYIYF